MEQVPIPPNDVRDPFERLVPGYDLGRDSQRTPMRWDHTVHGGFTSGQPWLPLGPDVAERNVATFQARHRSLLWLYRRLIELRRSSLALMAGEYLPLRSHNDLVAYKRVSGDEQILIALNIANDPRKLQWKGEGTILLSTHLDVEGKVTASPLLLRGNEGIVLRVEAGE